MGLKLRSYTIYFLYFITISLLFSLPTFAQSPKGQAKKPAQPKSDAQVKTLNTFNSTVAYKIWDDWYKAQEQGIQLPEPTLTIRAKDDKELNEISRTWNKAAQKAKLAAEKRREDARNGKTSFQTQSVFPLLPDSMQAAQPIPTTNALEHFNQPTKGIAGLSSYRMGTQPAIQNQPIPNNNANAVVMAQNNRSIAETNAKNISYNVAKAKELANIAFASTDSPGVTTKYHIDNNNPTGLPQVVEELQNDQVVRQYTYGADGIISMRQLINDQWVVSFFIKDGQGSVRMLTDLNGNVTDTYDYDAYGNLINQTGNTPNTRLYNSEEFDPDLGFYYLRARFLDTVKGRFISQDEEEGNENNPQSLHKYTYANNNPISNSDPTGKSTILTAQLSISFANVIAALPGFPTTQLTQRGGEGKPKSIRDTLCDLKLARIFGGSNAIAAGSGYDVPTLGYYKDSTDIKYAFREHVYKYLHIYGSEDGTGRTDLFLPPGAKYISPYGHDDGYKFFYEHLEDLNNVTLLASHVADFVGFAHNQKIETKAFPFFNSTLSVRIGTIGGVGGNNPPDYIHSHLSLTNDPPNRVKFNSSGSVVNAIPFSQVFCK